MPQTAFDDAYGHANARGAAGVALTAGAVSTTAVGTIAPTTGAGQTPTVTGVNANDQEGTFTLNPVTGGGAQAAGAVAIVTYAQPYAAVPKLINVQVTDNAGGAGSVIAASVVSSTITGFSLNVNAALTTAHTYSVSYQVVP